MNSSRLTPGSLREVRNEFERPNAVSANTGASPREDEMKRHALTLLLSGGFLLLALSSAPAPAQGGNPIDELKEILRLMKLAEQQLATASLEEGSDAQKEAIDKLKKSVDSMEKGSEEQKKALEALKKLYEDVEKKEGEAADRLSKQMNNIEERMGDIVKNLDKIIQSVKMSQGQGQSQLDMKNMPKPKQDQPGKPRKEKKDQGLKKMGEQEKSGKKDGQKEANSKGDAAKKPYEARRPDDKTARHRKAIGRGRWGNLPPKIFGDIVHPEDFVIPRKYEELVKKYFTLLGKNASKK
jgi:hypothetical protein